jgi:hypothetical protein
VYGREEMAKAKLPQRRGKGRVGMEGEGRGMDGGGWILWKGEWGWNSTHPLPPADLPSCLLGL